MGHLKIAKETLLLRTSTGTSDIDASDVANLVLPRPAVDTEDHESCFDPNTQSGPLQACGASVLLHNKVKSPQSIMARLVGNGHIVEVSAVDFEHQKYPDNLQSMTDLVQLGRPGEQQLAYARKIRFFYPYRIDPHCITLKEHDECFVLDVISGTRYLYTVQLPMSAFFASTLNINDSNAKEWRVIHSPYAFDLRQPLMMHAVSRNILIVALKDGGLLRLTRDAPLESIDTVEFREERSVISRLLPWGGERLPGKPGYSSRAIISMDHHSGLWGPRSRGLLATVTVNKKLRLWSIDGLDLVHENDIVGEKQSESGFLDPTPQKLVSFARDKETGNKSRLVVTLLPTNQSRFKLWEFVDLMEPRGVFKACMPDDGAVWFIADYLVGLDSAKNLDLLVSWKCGKNSTLMQMCTPVDGTKAPRWFLIEDADSPRKTKKPFEDQESPEYWLSKIFGPTGYSRTAIVLALSIYTKKMCHGFTVVDPALHLPLEEQVARTVGYHVSAPSLGGKTSAWQEAQGYKADIRKQWVQFETLCAEIDHEGKELLALSWTNTNGRVVVRSQFVSVIRDLQPVETLVLNSNKYGLDQAKAGTPYYNVLYLIKLARSFRESFDHTVQQALFRAFKDDLERARMYLTLDRMVQIYKDIMQKNESMTVVAELYAGLRHIKGLDATMSTILQLLHDSSNSKSFENFFAKLYGMENLHQHMHWDTVNALGSHMLDTSLYEVLDSTTLLVVDLLFLLVLVSGSIPELIPEHGTYYTSCIRLFKSLTSYYDLQKLGRPTRSYRHHSRDSDLVDDLTQLSVRKTRSTLPGQPFTDWFILQHDLTNIRSVWNALSVHEGQSSSDVVATHSATLAIDLYKFCMESQSPVNVVAEYMRTAFDHDYVSTFVQGCLLATCGETQNAVVLLKRASVQMMRPSVRSNEKVMSALENLSPVVMHAVGHGPVKYFKWTASFVYSASKDKDTNSALELARSGARFIGEVTEANKHDVAELLMLIVQYGLMEKGNARGFTESYDALSDLIILPQNSKEDIYDICNMFVMRSVESGYGLELCKLPFIGVRDVITQVLESKIKDDREGQIEYYSVLYAWKLARQDYAGAAAAVYNQAAKIGAKEDEASIEVLVKRSELLITAINALNCIPNKNDRYILVEKPIAKPEVDDHMKRRRLDRMTNGSRTQSVALLYSDLESERKSILDRLNNLLTVWKHGSTTM